MILRVWVKESEDYLNKLMKLESNSVSRDKLRILLLIKQNKVTEIKELVLILDRHRNSISNWLKKYRKSGINGLLEINSKGVSKKK